MRFLHTVRRFRDDDLASGSGRGGPHLWHESWSSGGVFDYYKSTADRYDVPHSSRGWQESRSGLLFHPTSNAGGGGV